MDQYLDIKWINLHSNWYEMKFDEISYKTKLCEVSDFGEDEKAEELFNAWKGFTLICPEKAAMD